MLAKLLQSARYANLVGVVALLLAAIAALGWAAAKSLTTILLIINSGAQDVKIPIALIEVVDSFLITTALFVFAFSLYELFIGGLKVPGWMLSTGTLRMLALLALLRHPIPPPLIVVEEIENGLDPRSIHLLVEEIRTAVLNGVTQVILTTHSPYLLDLLKLDQLVLVARDEKGEPRFHRPDDDAKLNEWAKDFAPGRLYTMGTLHEAAAK